jgi:hypothetical protein
MSFILKILEKRIDRHIKGGVLVEQSLHQNQYAYRAGMSTETALLQVVQRLENCLEHKEIALVPSWILREHSTIPLLQQLSRPTESEGSKKPVAGGSSSCLRAGSYTLP